MSLYLLKFLCYFFITEQYLFKGINFAFELTAFFDKGVFYEVYFFKSQKLANHLFSLFWFERAEACELFLRGKERVHKGVFTHLCESYYLACDLFGSACDELLVFKELGVCCECFSAKLPNDSVDERFKLKDKFYDDGIFCGNICVSDELFVASGFSFAVKCKKDCFEDGRFSTSVFTDNADKSFAKLYVKMGVLFEVFQMEAREYHRSPPHTLQRALGFSF